MSARFSPYYDGPSIDLAVAKGEHRMVVGGRWEEIGRLQFDYMLQQGLGRNDRLLDIGCGCMRGGVHFVRYLEPGCYFGVDKSQALLDAGCSGELVSAGLAGRLPTSNVLCDADFNFNRFGVMFRWALALSLFTHLPFNAIRVCLERLTEVMATGGTFHATYFELPDQEPTWQPFTHQGFGVTTHGSADPYHYRRDDFRHAAAGLPWDVHVAGAFGHPRGQHMLVFHRT